MRCVHVAFVVLVCAGVVGGFCSPSDAASVRAGFDATAFPGNDDDSVGPVAIGFNCNFFGTTYSQLYVNNNGNVTFDSPLWTYTPFNLLSTSQVIIAPFFADVDTRVGAVTKYGTGAVGVRNAFGVTWPGVGYFGQHIDKLNTFQLVIIDRSDVGAGDFDFEFNYDQIQWETGDFSGGSGGLGGNSARAGYSNGSTVGVELAGSAINGAFLDIPTAGTDSNPLSATGRYLFQVRNGDVTPTPVIPEPLTLTGLLLAGSALGLKLRKRQHA